MAAVKVSDDLNAQQQKMLYLKLIKIYKLYLNI